MEMDFWTLDSFFDYVLSVIVFTLTLTSSRKFWLWYWKIDVIVGLLESIDKKMGATTNQGTDLDPEEIPKIIDTHDPLHIPSDNDEEQEPDQELSIWVPIGVALITVILLFAMWFFLSL